jgi:GntR family transcriptional regulator
MILAKDINCQLDDNNMSDSINQAVQRIRMRRQEGVPKYLLLRNALAEEIASGRWGAGEKLPAEDVLATMTSLSLGTVQRSLRMLVEEGRLVRRHGTGTFVVDQEAPLGAPFQHCRFIDESNGKVLPIFSKGVRSRLINQQGPWSAHLPAGPIVCLERTFSINHEFALYTHLYFEGERLPKLATVDAKALKGVSIKDLLSRELHIYISRYSQNLSIRSFPGYVCKTIKVRPKTSGGVIELVAYDRRGEAVYFQDFFIPPNTRRLLLGT